MSRISTATQLFTDGCACSQAILAAFGEPLRLDRRIAMQIGAGFAGGMRSGEACGAVTGALMVLGLQHAEEDCTRAPGRAQVYAKVEAFIRDFQRKNGSIACRELLGCDISTPEGLTQAKEQNLFKTTCVRMVQNAATILEEMEAGSPSADARNT